MATRTATVVGWLFIWGFFLGWFLLIPDGQPKPKDASVAIGAAVAGSAAWFAFVLAIAALAALLGLFRDAVIYQIVSAEKFAWLGTTVSTWFQLRFGWFAIASLLLGIVLARFGWTQLHPQP